MRPCLPLLVPILWLVFSPVDGSQEPPAATFRSVAVIIDTGSVGLAAFQVEIRSLDGTARLIGVEGGSGAFSEPPHYDPEALTDGDRVVIAAYTLQDDLPTGERPVATLHYYVSGGSVPEFDGLLITAVDRAAQPIDATLQLVTKGDHR